MTQSKTKICALVLVCLLAVCPMISAFADDVAYGTMLGATSTDVTPATPDVTPATPDVTPATPDVTGTDVYASGDVNGNGKIEAVDALLALQASVNKIVLTGASFTAADMDKNGMISASDALAILQISVGRNATPTDVTPVDVTPVDVTPAKA